MAVKVDTQKEIIFGSSDPNVSRVLSKYRVLYVGGATSGVQVPSVETYLADTDIQYKKFIVVIDSLPRLLNKLGEDKCCLNQRKGVNIH